MHALPGFPAHVFLIFFAPLLKNYFFFFINDFVAEFPAQFLEVLAEGVLFLFLTRLRLTGCRGGKGRLQIYMMPDYGLLDTRVVLWHVVIGIDYHAVIVMHDVAQDVA